LCAEVRVDAAAVPRGVSAVSESTVAADALSEQEGGVASSSFVAGSQPLNADAFLIHSSTCVLACTLDTQS
jgi:hypothetical protein